MPRFKPQAIPFFGDAYLADTTHLGLDEHGAYFLLMLAAWRHPDCVLPDDDAKLARIVGLTKYKWLKIRPAVIGGFWELNSDGMLYQPRLQKEFAYLLNQSKTNSKNAKSGHEKNKSAQKFAINLKKNEQKILKKSSKIIDQVIENKETAPLRNGMRKACPSTSTSHLLIEVINKIIIEWNKMAGEAGLQKVHKLTSSRERAFKARLKDYTEAEFMTAIETIPTKSFLIGQNDRGWSANIDWLLRPSTITKISEGQYANKKSSNSDGFQSALFNGQG